MVTESCHSKKLLYLKIKSKKYVFLFFSFSIFFWILYPNKFFWIIFFLLFSMWPRTAISRELPNLRWRATSLLIWVTRFRLRVKCYTCTWWEQILYANCWKHIYKKHLDYGQVGSPELLETPEIMEKTENFIKVTKYLTKLKETLINYVWEEYHFEKH